MSVHARRQRADAADALCSAAFARAVGDGDEQGLALVAVGGFGRRELAPHSDLDVLLVHDDDLDPDVVTKVATQVWYPLWDAGTALDHSVRGLTEATTVAKRDVRVALGLLDARHLAGDPALTLRVRTTLLAQWRRDARRRLPELREMSLARARRHGELAHAAVPELKESIGGLRDATVLRALVATWLVDVPHTDLDRCRRQLLDVRDALHAVAGRATDRIAPELWSDLAAQLALADAEEAQRHVRGVGRRMTHLARLTWRRAEAVLAAPSRRRTPRLERVAPSLAVSAGEVVLAPDVTPAGDAFLLLRAAAEAAERDVALSPVTAARLLRSPRLPEPWPLEARRLLTRMLAAGPGLVPVWETLDETGALLSLFPEWEKVRLLPHASAVHRFTVDRHMVETCVEASKLIRRVARPDLLMVAALLHDIGKGGTGDHSVHGAPVAAAVVRRMGFVEPDVEVVARLVRWHLLLPEVATRRDLQDPATVEHVAERVGTVETLGMLAALTEADALATSSQAWSPWRAQLVGQLVERVRTSVSGQGGEQPVPVSPESSPEPPDDIRREPSRVDVRVEPWEDGSRVHVWSGDRLGLLAAAAAALAVHPAPVRSARAGTVDGYAFSVWEVAATDLDAALLRQRLEAVLEGRLDPGPRLAGRAAGRLKPVVAVRHDVSREATVLEVRVDDRPGVVYDTCRALAALDMSVRSAHVATVGPQVLDVFYLQEPGAGALGEERAARAAHAVRRALAGPPRGGPGYP